MSTRGRSGHDGDGTIDPNEEADRLRRSLTLVSELGVRITSTLDLQSVLQEVVAAACLLTEARYGALAVFDRNNRVVQFVTDGITTEERERIGDRPQGKGLLGWLHRRQKPLRLADLSSHPQSVGFPAAHPPMKSFLGAPLRDQGEGLGTLYLTEKKAGAEFTAEDEHLLALFASQAALAIRNAQRFESERDARAEAEAAHEALAQSQDALLAERQRLDTLVRTSPVGVLVLEAGSERVLLVNREAERILGPAHPEDEVFSSYEEIATREGTDGQPITPEELPVRRALNRGETVRAQEVRFRFSDDRTISTLVNATPIYDEDGTIAAAIATIQDMTPLEDLERLRSEFLGMVSHELRTPLTAIKGSAATVLGSREPFDPQEIREFFEIIDEQADRLRDLVNNLLDMTRIEAGTLSVSPEPIDLREVLEEATAALARAGSAQEVEVQIPEDLPAVNADWRRLVQVLDNLLSNAGKFSPDSSRITVSVDRQGDLAAISIRDRGRGLAREKLQHLFKKFTQVHDDGGQKLSGSGLGLAICKGIVEAHGGRIWANSEGEGHGTTFCFTLPVSVDGAARRKADTSRRDTHLGRVARAGQRTRILAVDDEPQVRRYLQTALQNAGYQPITTGDPSDVPGLIEMEEPELVLLDVMLPGTTGFELLQRIREMSGVPVIFLSARDREKDAVEALKAGADDYITKPFAPSELLARIEAVLRRRVIPDQIEVRPPFELGELTIDFSRRRAIVSGEEVKLTATEYKVLYQLAINSGMALTHDQLLHRVWGPEYSGETQLIRAFIRNLRRKLKDDARDPDFIFTEPQVGYRMPRP